MSYKILIVDDDPDQIELLRYTLEANGYKVLTAGNKKEGHLKISESKPDLILLDVMMETDTEGFDFASELQADSSTRDIPIIFQTSLSSYENYMQASFQSISQSPIPSRKFLDKPTEPAKLLAAVRDILK